MSKLAYRLAAALLVAGLAAPAFAEQDVLDIHADDYTASGGKVSTLFVVGVGMVEPGQQPATVTAEASTD